MSKLEKHIPHSHFTRWLFFKDFRIGKCFIVLINSYHFDQLFKRIPSLIGSNGDALQDKKTADDFLYNTVDFYQIN